MEADPGGAGEPVEQGGSVGGSPTPTPGTDRGGQTTIELEDDEGTDQKIKRLRIRASGIPVGKIADLNRGVLMPLMREVGAFEFVIELDLAGKDGISKRVIEQQVMETLRQLGAEVQEPD